MVVPSCRHPQRPKPPISTQCSWQSIATTKTKPNEIAAGYFSVSGGDSPIVAAP